MDIQDGFHQDMSYYKMIISVSPTHNQRTKVETKNSNVSKTI